MFLLQSGHFDTAITSGSVRLTAQESYLFAPASVSPSVMEKNHNPGEPRDGTEPVSGAVVDWSQLEHQLQYHEASGRWLVIVSDRRTGEVKYTIPPEELLDTFGRVREMVGLLLDTRV